VQKTPKKKDISMLQNGIISLLILYSLQMLVQMVEFTDIFFSFYIFFFNQKKALKERCVQLETEKLI
jgi:hypothetical protein